MRMLRGYSRAIYYPTPMLSRIDAWPLFSIFRRVRRWRTGRGEANPDPYSLFPWWWSIRSSNWAVHACRCAL